MMWLVFLFVLLFQGFQGNSAASTVVYTVRNPNDPNHYIAVHDIEPNNEYIARCQFQNRINQTGWSYLQCTTRASAQDLEQALGVGIAEGYSTAPIIELHWINTMQNYCNDKQDLCGRIKKFMQENLEWITEEMNQHSRQDAYWHQVQLVYTQVEGLYKGYLQWCNEEAKKGQKRAQMSLEDFIWLNGNGDLEDLSEALKTDEERTVGGPYLTRGKGRCSALVKITPDGSDLFVGQTTWNDFASMLRVQKLYNLHFRKAYQDTKLIPGSAASFSSYPGIITSGDDFYILSSGLVTLETTIGNGNNSLWANIKPVNQVPEWIRSLAANRLSLGGKEWTEIFSKFNSGTYNNQWMIVDYNLIKPGLLPKNLPPKVLWVLEQIPGFVHSEDLTSWLQKNLYWASYNTPFFSEIFNISGQAEMEKKYGDWFSFDRSPRAVIFRREHATVKDDASMLALMRYNNFTHDPASICDQCVPKYNGENAIAARSDLNPVNGTYPWSSLSHRLHGATDAKITSSKLVHNLLFWSQAGPPFGIDLPEFRWSNQEVDQPLGHPDVWKFEPELHKWN